MSCDVQLQSCFELDYGSKVFAGWRRAAADDWQAYTRHDFVRRLGRWAW